ncbi:putative choline kinase [Aspergillus clavatus NRRL 1]|uniref:Choline kinase, putative n=1 Tax=Aspergillus clavatus (strain ATCC 1007 / CBS 513.65 / DSM 816 / NCTC 3887 / NRRL 1 / QM 1276 / 107) TaxID=344612 RepID=A1CNL5_ASPCL|nr:choline kinase, putative [Aspergillus clavatus NRRL 1]EAW07236.1 choline kinase, putative [Aspergillus clavatus NRRL 1]
MALESDHFLDGLKPISGTGLNIPSFQKILAENGQASPASPAAEGSPAKQHRASFARKATARPPLHTTSHTPSVMSEPRTQTEKDHSAKHTGTDPRDSLFHQVYEWLQHEKAKQKTCRSRLTGTTQGTDSDGDDDYYDGVLQTSTFPGGESPPSLDKLEKILVRYAALRIEGSAPGHSHRGPTRKRSRIRGLRRGSVSESDYYDVDAAAPSVDALLDNSKTLAYTGGSAEDGGEADDRRSKDREAWLTFKNEIARLAITLRLKGWRKFPQELAGEIEVVRLSGALTNAVYVVNPPKALPPPKAEDGSFSLIPQKLPPKLLLRIYGPQVDHLIDRENELQILRRLGRKHIGPRVLGTFNNGRFEEFFEARPLTPKDLRVPDTMKQIAKRMRELHEGIDLLEEEREGGPVVFKNWDKWVDRCEQVINWLDEELQSEHNEARAASEPWRRRGFVCGVPWALFRKAVDNYRKWLVSSCGGMKEIKRQLVFAHNDTQYGNLLRMEPSSESPLLLPENKHKQLVVIDFEYASANTPGFEFANHFSEWCYNYHDAERPWACNNSLYPTSEQQRVFIASYLTHSPGVRSSASPSITPLMRGNTATITPFVPLDLDSNTDADLQRHLEVEKSQGDALEAEIQSLMKQTRMWRVINSAQWVAWGIVQAKVPGMEESAADVAAKGSNGNGHSEDSVIEAAQVEAPEQAAADAEADEFDYLAYAQDRAMFFWADLLALRLVREDELPPPMVELIRARKIDY